MTSPSSTKAGELKLDSMLSEALLTLVISCYSCAVKQPPDSTWVPTPHWFCVWRTHSEVEPGRKTLWVCAWKIQRDQHPSSLFWRADMQWASFSATLPYLIPALLHGPIYRLKPSKLWAKINLSSFPVSQLCFGKRKLATSGCGGTRKMHVLCLGEGIGIVWVISSLGQMSPLKSGKDRLRRWLRG